METDEQVKDRVIALVNEVNRIFAGIDETEAKTALTLTVAGAIITTADDNKESRLKMVQEFSRQVKDYVEREDWVEYVQASIRYDIPPPERKQ